MVATDGGNGCHVCGWLGMVAFWQRMSCLWVDRYGRFLATDVMFVGG